MYQDQVGTDSQTKGPDVFGPKHCNQDESKAVTCRAPSYQSIPRGDFNGVAYEANNPESRSVPPPQSSSPRPQPLKDVG